MAMRKTDQEKIEELRLKQRQIDARIKELTKKDNERGRKERTRRLIQNGALAEKYLNCEGVTTDELESLLIKLVNISEVKALITPAVER